MIPGLICHAFAGDPVQIERESRLVCTILHRDGLLVAVYTVRRIFNERIIDGTTGDDSGISGYNTSCDIHRNFVGIGNGNIVPGLICHSLAGNPIQIQRESRLVCTVLHRHGLLVAVEVIRRIFNYRIVHGSTSDDSGVSGCNTSCDIDRNRTCIIIHRDVIIPSRVIRTGNRRVELFLIDSIRIRRARCDICNPARSCGNRLRIHACANENFFPGLVVRNQPVSRLIKALQCFIQLIQIRRDSHGIAVLRRNIISFRRLPDSFIQSQEIARRILLADIVQRLIRRRDSISGFAVQRRPGNKALIIDIYRSLPGYFDGQSILRRIFECQCSRLDFCLTRRCHICGRCDELPHSRRITV